MLKDLGSVTGWKSLGHNGCAALIWPLANSPSESKHWLVQCTPTVFFKTFSAKMAVCFDENMWFKAKSLDALVIKCTWGRPMMVFTLGSHNLKSELLPFTSTMYSFCYLFTSFRLDLNKNIQNDWKLHFSTKPDTHIYHLGVSRIHGKNKKFEIQWVPYLIPFLLFSGFQNSFCFCSSSIGRPSPTNFRLQWEFQCENDQKNEMAKNHFSGVQNGSQSV